MSNGYQRAQTDIAPQPSRGGESLLVVELSDDVGPRRHPDKPNLSVNVVIGDPHGRFEQIKRSGRGPAKVRDFGLRPRDDLTPELKSSTRKAVEVAKTKLIKDLRQQGYTVNGTTNVWHVYVIELDDSVRPKRKTELPWVYVGETSLGIEDRYRQHTEGAHNARGRLYSPVVMKHHVRLRPDLYETEPTLFSQDDSKRAERALADRLRRTGYSVKGGH